VHACVCEVCVCVRVCVLWHMSVCAWGTCLCIHGLRGASRCVLESKQVGVYWGACRNSRVFYRARRGASCVCVLGRLKECAGRKLALLIELLVGVMGPSRGACLRFWPPSGAGGRDW
jgi:hypothetical protein